MNLQVSGVILGGYTIAVVGRVCSVEETKYQSGLWENSSKNLMLVSFIGIIVVLEHKFSAV